MISKIKADIMAPQDILSKQQKQIYRLLCQGLSNKEIAVKLNIEPRSVATQLSRIKKKVSNLGYTYKIEAGAEHDQYSLPPISPAEELKKRIKDDSGFFKLMFNKYASNEETQNENVYRLASSSPCSSTLLHNNRAKQIKIMAACGGCSSCDKIAARIEKTERIRLREYLQKLQIRPLHINWDDGSAVYLIGSKYVKRLQQIHGSFYGKRPVEL